MPKTRQLILSSAVAMLYAFITPLADSMEGMMLSDGLVDRSRAAACFTTFMISPASLTLGTTTPSKAPDFMMACRSSGSRPDSGELVLT